MIDETALFKSRNRNILLYSTFTACLYINNICKQNISCLSANITDS